MEKKKRNKFSFVDKEEAVRKVLEEGFSYSTVATVLSTSPRLVNLWVSFYKEHGSKGFSSVK